ncbi:hypothetical protein KDA11_01965 [Candidatus Saccharibacteria bacterium]|nr:hypothetical protein [Candidatus Saccharibacteria bacterium]
MNGELQPVDFALEMAYLSNQEFDSMTDIRRLIEETPKTDSENTVSASTLHEQLAYHQGRHDLCMEMAGMVLGQSQYDPTEVNLKSDSQNETMSAERAQKLLSHIRNERIIDNLVRRHEVKQAVRTVLDSRGFIEVDTPILGSAMVEYTTDNFVVHGNAGEFYLPQSPQVYKQALVINSFARYFQFARCFRDERFDEPERTDQLHEFTQIDIEFRCDSDTELRNFAEEIVTDLFAQFGKECPKPFPVIDHQECIERYGTDKPDLRQSEDELAFLWVVNFPQFIRNEQGEIVATHHPFQMPNIDDIADIKDRTFEIGSSTFDLVLNGVEIGGGDMRINNAAIQRAVFDVLGLNSSQFGLLLESLKDGKAPKHGGMAIGLDRITMAITDTPSIKDVTAFNL